MFYNQPLAHRFGAALADDIESARWNRIEMAVAWVRRSGMQHLETSFRQFLGRGGLAQVTVGVDIENTSTEGLGDLLALEQYGNIETFVHHNETETTFHPKVYLLANQVDARLIVGSNNLTEAGLFVNTEAGLRLDAPVSDPLINDARQALASWRDPTTGFARRLDTTLLEGLVELGYVFPERRLQNRRRRSYEEARRRRPNRSQALFRAQRFSAPPVRRPDIVRPPVAATILLMRVRRASETGRRTQVQIPFAVVETDFFSGIDRLVSAHDGRNHSLIRASAHGSRNTVKVEIPEIDAMDDPVLRLERSTRGVAYRAYDASSRPGRVIRRQLLDGFAMSPPASFSTISHLERATWWRFL